MFYCLLFCVIAGETELCQLDEFCSWIMTKAAISGEVLPTADYKMKAVYQFCDSLLPGFLSHLFFQLF